jgi:hypothetical protein
MSLLKRYDPATGTYVPVGLPAVLPDGLVTEEQLAAALEGLGEGGGGGGTTDHGDLTGLADDDHPQYARTDGTRGQFAPPGDYVTDTDPRLSDARTPTAHGHDYETAGAASAAVTSHDADANAHPALRTRLTTLEGAAPTYLAFNAGGNASAARPSIPSTSTVAWFNVPSQPTNLGTFDVWEDKS